MSETEDLNNCKVQLRLLNQNYNVLVDDNNGLRKTHQEALSDLRKSGRIFRWVVGMGAVSETIVLAVALYHFW